jgi:hypothetical protein
MTSQHGDQVDVDAQLEEYLLTAIDWDDLQDEPQRANVAFDRNQRLQKALRLSVAGRRGIAALARHDRSSVRLLAATHMLAWDPEQAESILAVLEATSGLVAVSAKYTLRTYHAGGLDLDW